MLVVMRENQTNKTLMEIGTDWIGNGISNYHKIIFFHRGPCNAKLKIHITKFEN